MRTRRWATALLTAAALTGLGLAAPASGAASTLTGTFQLTGGSCSGGSASGTYFRMILPSGGASGPYLSNSDSACSDQTYTPLQPGTDGGLETGAYQPAPSPAFDSQGNALARRITQPATFYGTGFALATGPTDPQTSTAVPKPTITVTGDQLGGDLRAFAVTWNDQDFNQGSPKPDGSTPGNTRAVSGTYDAATGTFTVEWASQIVGGPFDKFTGFWHLTGHFVAASGGSAPVAAPAPSKAKTSSAARTSAAPVVAVPSARTAPASAAAAPVEASPSAGSPSAAPAPQAAAGQPVSVGQGAPTVTTSSVSHDHWKASGWLIALAVALAVVGFGVVIRLQLALRSAAAS